MCNFISYQNAIKNVYNANYFSYMKCRIGPGRLLSKPIKFFYEMQLFVGTNADGFLSIDQDTCVNNCDDSKSDDSQGLNDMSGYALPEDLTGDDSDTLPSPLSNKPGGESSCSTSQAGTKSPRGSKSPSKKPKEA
jgi:hypothetical protein